MGTLQKRIEAIGVLTTAFYQTLVAVQRAGHLLDYEAIQAAYAIALNEWTYYSLPGGDGEPEDLSSDDELGSEDRS